MSKRQNILYWLFFFPAAFPGWWILNFNFSLSWWPLLLLTILNAFLAGGVAYPLAMRAGKVRHA